MKQLTVITLVAALFFSSALTVSGQGTQVVYAPVSPYSYWTTPIILDGDTVPRKILMPIYLLLGSRKGGKHSFNTADIQKLIRNVKIVYPIAKEANRRLREVDAKMATIKSKKDQSAYIKQVEKDLKTEYTPVLKQITFSQGKILIKLIDRETSNTSYELVKQLRGTLSAFFWQSIARIFGANLKDTYKKEGEDKLIEEIIVLYEAGLI